MCLLPSAKWSSQTALRVEEDGNIADLSPYDKYKQISSPIRWWTYINLLVPTPHTLAYPYFYYAVANDIISIDLWDYLKYKYRLLWPLLENDKECYIVTLVW